MKITDYYIINGIDVDSQSYKSESKHKLLGIRNFSTFPHDQISNRADHLRKKNHYDPNQLHIGILKF
jgi:hypothetical protein